MLKKILCCLTTCTVLASFAGIDDYRYQPYPVLLVHGFNASPSTFGVYTEKEANRGDDKPNKKLIMSTKMIDNFGTETDKTFNTDHSAWSLIKSMGAGGDDPLNNSSTNNYSYFNPSDVIGRYADLGKGTVLSL